MSNYIILFLLILLNIKCSNFTGNKRMDNYSDNITKAFHSCLKENDNNSNDNDHISKEFSKICIDCEYEENDDIKGDLNDLDNTFNSTENDSNIYYHLCEKFKNDKKIIFDALKLLCKNLDHKQKDKDYKETVGGKIPQITDEEVTKEEKEEHVIQRQQLLLKEKEVIGGKIELLNDKYTSEKICNVTLKKGNKILKCRFSPKIKNRFLKLLQNNEIGIKHLIALKLNDIDLLQREFHKIFYQPGYNDERLQTFFRPKKIFHQYERICYEPGSIITHVATGKNGMTLIQRILYDNILNYKKLDSFDNIYAKKNYNILPENEIFNYNSDYAALAYKKAYLCSFGCINTNLLDTILYKAGYDKSKEQKVEVIQTKRERVNIGPVFSFGKDWLENIQPKYKNLKEEILNNKYVPITQKTWNGILKKCLKIVRGEFLSKRIKNRWSKILKRNEIGMKCLVTLKLYTDFDLLQREFRKSFRQPCNETKGRLQSFCHWRQAFQETFEKFSRSVSGIIQPKILFHGINSIFCIDQYEGIFYGPCSTTADLNIARSFAGKNGMLFVFKLKDMKNTCSLDVSWISDYPDEKEYLLFNHNMKIVSWILSSDYDQYYNYYHDVLTKGKEAKKPSGHFSLQEQNIHSAYLAILKELSQERDMQKKGNILNLKKSSLEEKEITSMLMFLFIFILSYKYPKSKISKYNQSLNANILHVMNDVDVVYMPSEMTILLIEKLKKCTGIFKKVNKLLNKKFKSSCNNSALLIKNSFDEKLDEKSTEFEDNGIKKNDNISQISNANYSDIILIEYIQTLLNDYFIYTKWKLDFPSEIPAHVEAVIFDKDCIDKPFV